jgi:hypothetical protein
MASTVGEDRYTIKGDKQMTMNTSCYAPHKITSFVNDEDGLRVLCEDGEIIGWELPDGHLILEDPDAPWSSAALWDMYQGSATSKWRRISENETLTPETRDVLYNAMIEEAADFYFFAFGEIKSREFIRREIEWPERD